MLLNRLDKVFTNRGIQNRVVAKYLEKSEETVSRWRNNARQPSIEQLNEIAKLLRMNVKELLHDSDWSSVTSPTYEELKKLYKGM